MSTLVSRKRAIAAGSAALVTALLAAGQPRAADHADGPQASGDPAADLGDLYAWVNGDRLVVIVTYAPLLEASDAPVFDADVLYTIHIDNDDDHEPDHSIWVRFGQNMSGEWGYRVENVPGLGFAFQGPVDTVVDGDVQTRAWAGLADDPFFFDLEGWQDTVANIAGDPSGPGNLAFEFDRDSLAGLNTMVIALEFPLDAAVLPGEPIIQVWAETGRRP